MMQTILVQLFYFVTCMANIMQIRDESRLVTLVKEVMLQYFYNENCVVFASGNPKYAGIIEAALMQTIIPSIGITENTQTLVDNHVCGGFILVTNSESRIREAALELQNGNYGRRIRCILVHNGEDKIILIFMPHNKSFELKLQESNKQITLNNVSQNTNRICAPKLDGKIRISFFKCSPHIIYDEHTGIFDGIDYHMLNDIMKGLPVEYVPISQITPGNTSYDTSLQDIIHKKMDLSVCAMWLLYLMNESSLPNFEYTQMTGQLCFALLVPKPQLLPESSYILQPLPLGVWIIIVLVIILGSKLLQVVSKLNFCTETKNCIVYDNFMDSALHTIQLFTFGGAARKSSLKQMAFCYIIVSFSLTFVLLSTAYSAGFSSILTYPRFYKHIRNIQELAESDYKVVCKKGAVETYRQFLEHSTNPHLNTLAEKLVDNSNGLKEYARIVKVVGKRYALDTENYTAYDKTRLTVIDYCTFTVDTALPIQYNSQLLPYINQGIVDLQEHGFNHHYYEMVASNPINKLAMYDMNNFRTSYVNYNFEHKPLNLPKIQAAFWLLTAGCICAFVVFILEICCH